MFRKRKQVAAGEVFMFDFLSGGTKLHPGIPPEYLKLASESMSRPCSFSGRKSDPFPEKAAELSDWIPFLETRKPMTQAEFEDLHSKKSLDFRNRLLRGLDMSYSVLNDADFSGAKLDGVQLYKSDLERAKFRNAKIRDADFTKTNLTKADFTGVKPRRSAFVWTGNKGVRGGENVPWADDRPKTHQNWNRLPSWYNNTTGWNDIPALLRAYYKAEKEKLRKLSPQERVKAKKIKKLEKQGPPGPGTWTMDATAEEPQWRLLEEVPKDWDVPMPDDWQDDLQDDLPEGSEIPIPDDLPEEYKQLMRNLKQMEQDTLSGDPAKNKEWDRRRDAKNSKRKEAAIPHRTVAKLLFSGLPAAVSTAKGALGLGSNLAGSLIARPVGRAGVNLFSDFRRIGLKSAVNARKALTTPHLSEAQTFGLSPAQIKELAHRNKLQDYRLFLSEPGGLPMSALGNLSSRAKRLEERAKWLLEYRRPGLNPFSEIRDLAAQELAGTSDAVVKPGLSQWLRLAQH
jgi:hypothetical protein